MSFRKPYLSLIAVAIIFIALSYSTFSRSVMGVLNWDVTGYYMYWPSTVIYHDLKMKDNAWAEALREKYDLSGTLYQFNKPEGRDNFVDQYTCGMAVMYAPAFFAGHALAKPLGYEADGFSPPYQYAVAIWSLLVAGLGLFFFRRLLLYFFDDALAAVILLLIAFGTNYFIQITRGLATPHNYLFTLYALFLWGVVQWHKSGYKHILMLIVPFGLMCLTRPTELVAACIPLFWGCLSFADFKLKWKTIFKEHSRSIFLGALVLLLIASPQLLYWKYAAGKFFYMSYTNPGEGFDFLYPHTVDFLISYRKGWFIYSPLVLLTIVAFLFVRKSATHRDKWLALGIFFLLNLYIVSSWSCWWYAQCFSQRAMVQSLPVLGLMMGFGWLSLRETIWLKRVVGSLGVLLFAYSVFLSWQYDKGIIDQWRTTKDYFWAVFLTTESPDEKTKDLLMVKRDFSGKMSFDDSLRYTPVKHFTYRELWADQLNVLVPNDSSVCERLTSSDAFTKGIQFHYREWTNRDHIWLKGFAEVFIPEGHKHNDLLLVATADHKGPYGYASFEIPDSLFHPGWNIIRMEYLTPEIRHRNDDLSVYLWYRGNDTVYVKNIDVRSFERNENR